MSASTPSAAQSGASRRRGCRPLGCLVVLFLLLAGAGFALGPRLWQEGFVGADVVVGDEPTTVEVRPGESARGVVDRLVAEGVLDHARIWPLWLRAARPGGCLQAGEHTLPATATPLEVFAALCAPAYAPGVRVTIPEGTNTWQLADALEAAGLGDRDRYVELGFDPAFVATLGVNAATLEGYVAPDTYEFDPEVGEEDVLRRLVAQQSRVLDGLGVDEAIAATGFTLDELLTVASIVEEEAQVPEERPLIARVIYNRLAAGMPLQCDPTCVYSPTLYGTVPTRAACRDPSSTHSTYVVPGLPPTPISNPGRDAIRATFEPAADPDVLYFVAYGDGSGRHAFADTLEAHNRNVNQYVRGR